MQHWTGPLLHWLISPLGVGAAMTEAAMATARTIEERRANIAKDGLVGGRDWKEVVEWAVRMLE